MDGSKTRCATCGVSIQQRTAGGHFGLCRPCYHETVKKPPDGFEVPHELVRRIRSQGGDPATIRDMVWRDGAGSTQRLLDLIDAAADEYRRWAPPLRAFAADCRQACPAPRIESLSAAEQAQNRLLYTRMREFAESEDGRVTVAPRPHHLAVLSTNREGLAAAEEVFGGSGAVILEEPERTYWFSEVYEGRGDACWWYSFASWSIEGGVGEVPEPFRGRVQALADRVYWVLNSGVQWGPLAGAGQSELWLWDGERATWIEGIGLQS